MAKADDILERMGTHMAESIGVRTASPESAAKYDGIRLARDKGEVAIEQLTPDPTQPRKEFDQKSLQEMAQSIETGGIRSPLKVRWQPDLGKWVILTGERRYRSAILAKLASVPCILLDRELNEDEIEEEQLIENLHRKDLTPLEQARAFKRRIDRRGITQSALANELHITKSQVARALALLELPEEVQDQVAAGKLGAQAAYEISKLPDADSQRAVAGEALAAGKTTKEAVVNEVRRKSPERKPRIHQPLILTYRHKSGLKATLRIEMKHRRGLPEAWAELSQEIAADLRQKSSRRMAA